MASLTSSSFKLDARLPTVTVEAESSKHRRKDVLPLHPDLWRCCGDWLNGLGPADKLFPIWKKELSFDI